MNSINEVFTAVVRTVNDKDSDARASELAAATAAAVAAALSNTGAVLPDENDYVTDAIVTPNPLDNNGNNEDNEDNAYGTGASDSDPGHPDGQVSESESPTLVSPLVEDISIVQTLISPSISSDNASVSVDITIDGNAEEYEIYWVTV